MPAPGCGQEIIPNNHSPWNLVSHFEQRPCVLMGAIQRPQRGMVVVFTEIIGSLRAYDQAYRIFIIEVVLLGDESGDFVQIGLVGHRHAENAFRIAGVELVIAISATASPMAAECLKPCPEQADTTMTRGQSGKRSIRKLASGELV